MSIRRAVIPFALCLGFAAPHTAQAQWDVIAKAALPAVPYWWTASHSPAIDLIPLAWTNDVDGGSSGCCVLGAAGRARLGRATVWLGLGFGTEPDGGSPAAVEAAAQIDWGVISYRNLHGRTGVSLFFPLLIGGAEGSTTLHRLSAGISALSLDDERYFDPVPLFSCPESPAAPCETVSAPYPWSPDQDFGLALEGAWGRGEWRAPRLGGSAVLGLKTAGGDYRYVRGELDAQVAGVLERFDYTVRAAGGWVSDSSPLQRRFLLSGADPVTRWLNPYIDVQKALFQDIAYFMPGGPQLRAYTEIQPLATGYLSLAGVISESASTPSGFWGRLDAFVETAWRADAGFAFAGGFRNIGVAVSLPLWASNPSFADPPEGDGIKSAFALRWALSIMFYPHGRPGN
jgi:hypothetical protein